MPKKIFDLIKKQNGETFAKTIRSYDNGVFDIPNLCNIVKYAGRQAEPILPYLISLKNIKIDDKEDPLPPEVLLEKAGYNAYYADTLSKQNAILKYFAPNEELCTFNDTNRYINYYIINAVKKNVDQIKRADFLNPVREDAYGVSVISIQILKSGGFISIKNRYNHTVENPDNTFNSNPDNIIPGLSASLKKRFNVDFSSQHVSVPNGYVIINGKIIKYQTEYNNVYIGDSFYIKDGQIYELNRDFQTIIDNMFVLDLKNKKIYNPAGFNDPFPDILNKEFDGKKLHFVPATNDEIQLLADNTPLFKLNKNRCITSLYLHRTTYIGEFFMYRGKHEIRFFAAPNLKHLESNFLYHNKCLETFLAPHLEMIENNFLFHNKKLKTIYIPSLKSLGNNFLQDNETLTRFSAPELTEIGSAFLYANKNLKKFYAPKLECIRGDFIFLNEHLQHFFAKRLESVGDCFLPMNRALRLLRVPKLKKIGKSFLMSNQKLRKLFAPNLENVQDDCLESHLKRNFILTRKNIPQNHDSYFSRTLFKRLLFRKNERQ